MESKTHLPLNFVIKDFLLFIPFLFSFTDHFFGEGIFATNLVNGQKQPDGSIKSLTPKQVADLLGHSTSQITEMYYVKKDTARLNGITDGFEM